jgi:hypothetical protein
MKSILMSLMIGAGALLAASSSRRRRQPHPLAPQSCARTAVTGLAQRRKVHAVAIKECRTGMPPLPLLLRLHWLVRCRLLRPTCQQLQRAAAVPARWVNKSSKVYHCPTDKWYAKPRNGEYMTEHDAVTKGLHADHGKAC